MPTASSWRPQGARLRALDPRRRWIAITLAVAAAAPFVIAAFQAIADGWYPTGDNGQQLTVARQVFTANTPLTGEVASGTRYGAHPFHPGPLVYYFLGPFVKVFGGAHGMILGAAFVSAASVLLIGYVALRTAGSGAAVWALLTTMAMCWSLEGTAFLYSPFKTILALLVILLFLHLSTALVSGHSTLLPLWVLVGSFPAAATMRYALPVLAVAGVTVALVLVLRWRRVRGPDGLRRLVTIRRAERRALVTAAVVALVCWWGPLYEAAIHKGGNFVELYHASRVAAEEVDGPRVAIGEQAKALLYDTVMSPADFHRSPVPYLVVAGIVAVAIVALAVRFRHRLTRPVWAGLAIAGPAIVFMTASLATTPADEGIGVYRTLASAPVGAFAVFAAGLVVGAVLAGRRPQLDRAVPVAMIALLLVGIVAVAVPGPIDPSVEQYPWASAATQTLVEQAVPELRTRHGLWSAWPTGGRTIDTVFIGFKAGIEGAGVTTSIDARAIGLRRNLETDSLPFAGTILVQDGVFRAPGGDWTRIATYRPADRDEDRADEVAEQLAAFARRTNPRPLEVLKGVMPNLLCPELAEDSFQGDCPAADEVLASDNPIAELDPGIIALIYDVQFGEDTQYPVLDGPKPPDELLDAARETWDDIPVDVYMLPADSS